MAFDTAIDELKSVLGERVSLSKSDLDIHGASETYFPLTPPDAVAYPESTEDVARIVSVCAREGVPVIGWGTGTSLEGHALAFQGGVTVDFSLMDKVISVQPEDMTCVVQPGVTREALNEELRATGLFFPVDPGANASLGGMAGTRASGTTAVRYGTMKDNVLALEVVLADGRTIRTGTRARKSSSGYDLTSLFVGSEGTLGLTTELTLKLSGIPEAMSSAVGAFETIEGAVDAVIATIQMGIPMARIEFVDAATVDAVNVWSAADFPLAPHLLVEFHGSDASVAEHAERFGEIAADFGGQDFQWSSNTEERNRLWKMRHEAYWAILASRKGSRAVVTDMCVPISRLAEAIDVTRTDIAESGLSGPILGHVGDGNFHAILLVDPDDPSEVERAQAVANRMVERSLKMDGTATGEHGIGVGKLAYMEAEHGDGWEVMGQIKRALDPDNILNPGKLVRSN